MGRTLFGVIDTTGILQYGQVFIQYSKNINYKNYCKNNVFNIIICTKDVIITKNPCIVSGDVRRFQAVDVEALHYLVQCFCIIFKLIFLLSMTS